MKKEDFHGMEFNPFATFGETKMVKQYPRLGKLVAFSVLTDDYKMIGWTNKNLDTMARFVVVFIDTESPLFDTRNYEDRKKKALNVFKIKEGDVEYDEINDSGELFREMIFQFFTFIHNINYEQWLTYKMQIHNFNKYLRGNVDFGVEAKDINARRALMKEIPSMTEKMMKLEALIFNDKRTLKIINEGAVQNSIGSYPEKYAKNPPWQEQLK